MMKKHVFALSFSILLCGFGCSKSGEDANVTFTCPLVYDKLVACGFLTEGEVDCRNFIGYLDSLWRCELHCLADAVCAEVGLFVCDGMPTGNFEICANACWDKYAFECDGGELEIRLDQVCDCEVDCADGSDEEYCPASACFNCQNGLSDVPKESVCDCRDDCADASDELNCDPYPSCACTDGLPDIPLGKAFDGHEDRADGPDKDGDKEICAQFFCGS